MPAAPPSWGPASKNFTIGDIVGCRLQLFVRVQVLCYFDDNVKCVISVGFCHAK